MAKITPVENTFPIVCVNEIPPSGSFSLQYGLNPSKRNGIPCLQVNIKYVEELLKITIAVYNVYYTIESEGIIIEDHIYMCCKHATDSMRELLQFDEIGRTIPQQSIRCPGKEVFQSDLIDLAKALNFLSGKRDNFPR